jgi:hypothetical protein
MDCAQRPTPRTDTAPETGPRIGIQQAETVLLPGHASGWIEARQGNKKRKRPSISHYYCWDTRDKEGKPKRRKLYIPAGKVATVQQMVTDRRPLKTLFRFSPPVRKPILKAIRLSASWILHNY